MPKDALVFVGPAHEQKPIERLRLPTAPRAGWDPATLAASQDVGQTELAGHGSKKEPSWARRASRVARGLTGSRLCWEAPDTT